ncbi:MAG: response regulator transcription factor [Alphaproteobacteria bacterium]|nr:response regulator transcription factor [Alphaproteobacteria bacterium]
MRVLLVEDDKSMANNIKLLLTKEGMVVDVENLGEDGLETGKFCEYDIILLDLMLPDMPGFDVLKKLRASKIKTPILILSGLNTPDKKVRGFLEGADDYLTKPFDKNELIARIRAIVRRSQGHAGSIITIGDLEVNLDAKTVTAQGKPIHLTGKEFAIVELLALRKGTTLSKEQFLYHLYDGMDEPEAKIIDVFICKIRKKLTDATGCGDYDYIGTNWGRGYILQDSSKN